MRSILYNKRHKLEPDEPNEQETRQNNNAYHLLIVDRIIVQSSALRYRSKLVNLLVMGIFIVHHTLSTETAFISCKLRIMV